MTTAAEQTAEQKDAALKARTARELKLNEGKSGKGTRTFLGLTRGRNPLEIQYENWDESQADSLPTTLSEFMDALKTRGIPDSTMESEVVRRLILGDNELLYKEASDPVAEFIEASWPEDVKRSFRLVVRNYSQNANVSIEDAVSLIKPGIQKAVDSAAKA